MRYFTALVLVAVGALAACSTMTGKTAGENIDDMKITSEVKAKLVAEQISNLTRVWTPTSAPSISPARSRARRRARAPSRSPVTSRTSPAS